MIVINAKDQIAGRIGTRTAKLLLAGEEVAIINSEHAVISGKQQVYVNDLVSRRSQKNKRDPAEGPKYPRVPHLYLRRIIRGMMPKKSQRGRDAMKLLRCYIGEPANIDAKAAVEPFVKAGKPQSALQKSTTIGKVCAAFGWKN